MNYGCCDGYNGDHRKEQFSKDQAAPSQRSIKNIDDYAWGSNDCVQVTKTLSITDCFTWV